MNQSIHVVCVGGGHCNVQVLKHLKRIMPDSVKLTLLTDSPRAFYSGMLPGAVCKFYVDNDITLHLGPLATWCRAEYIEKKVIKVVANENRIVVEDGSSIEYDLAIINVGSRTRGRDVIEGVWEYSLSTRPINFLLSNIVAKET
jgi:NADH dehydrogenase FAD-containing subunit